MNKKIVNLSDTSHPFTANVDETDIEQISDDMVDLLFSAKVDETDNDYRTLTGPEFEAIRAFQSKWGYVGNHDISDDLVDMLADTTTDTNRLIERIMRKWDLSGPGYDGIRTDLENLFALRISVQITSDQAAELASLPGEKSDIRFEEARKTAILRNQLFRQEADKRVTRYFIGQTGWAWFVHFIVDMPEEFDETFPNVSKSLYRAKDGKTTLHMTSLYKTEEQAWDRINEDIREVSRYDDGTLTHIVQLDKM